MYEKLRLFTKLLFLALCFAVSCKVYAQTVTPLASADFSMPDTVCRDGDVVITNLSQGATTYFWKFCTGDPLTDMRGIDLGNPSGFLQVPLGVALVRENENFYAFVTNAGNGTITRISWGNSLLNPVTAENLGNLGILTTDIFGIQIKNDQGNWYGFVAMGNQLVRLNFGSSLSVGVPSAQIVAASPFIDKARGLVIEKDGNNWVGFCTTYPRKTITRFSWGPTLVPNPVVADLGNVGGLTDPMQPALIWDNSGWYLFVANTTSLAQLDFGNSLLNLPTGINYGNMGWMTDDRGISLFMECNNPYGFITNHNLVDNLILQINFKGSIAGSKSITPLGSVANLYLPWALSESLNSGDTIYTIVLNESTITTLYFPPCTNSPFPPSTQFDPSPIKFHDPGKYTVKLTIDMGLPTEQTVCREIYVDATLPVNLGNDTTICEGTSIQLDAGTGFTNYLWNTGETTSIIVVDTAGNYSVLASKTTGCHSEDTISLNISQKGAFTVDTAICYGEKYYAGGKWQITTGTYYDSLYTKYNCDSIVTTFLNIKPEIVVTIEKDTCVYSGNTFELTAHGSGAISWLWQDGSHDSVFSVHEPGKYWVTGYISNCHGSDTAIIRTCPALIFFPSAFTPNGDGLNDYFQPKGTDINDFYMIIFDRWGSKVFETRDPGRGWDGTMQGAFAGPGGYSYIATFGRDDDPGGQQQITGTFTLVR